MVGIQNLIFRTLDICLSTPILCFFLNAQYFWFLSLKHFATQDFALAVHFCSFLPYRSIFRSQTEICKINIELHIVVNGDVVATSRARWNI